MPARGQKGPRQSFLFVAGQDPQATTAVTPLDRYTEDKVCPCAGRRFGKLPDYLQIFGGWETACGGRAFRHGSVRDQGETGAIKA